MALGRKVKTMTLMAEANVAAAAIESPQAVGTFQDDVTVIAAYIAVHAQVNAAMTTGALRNHADVSRIGQYAQNGMLTYAIAQASFFVGAFGPSVGNAQIEYPDGKGMDFDDGDAIYLNCNFINTDAAGHAGSARCVIHYLER